MTGLDERGRAFENKWAHDAQTRFKVEARRNRALGLWAAAAKGLSGPAAENLADAVIAADFEETGDEDVFRKLRAELDPAQYPDAVIRTRMQEELDAAVAAVTGG
jgi:hypothetical protein